jgi:single-stranded DNA-binding protein
VHVEGKLSSRTYQIQPGETRPSNDINVMDVQFLGQRDSGGGEVVGVAEADGHHVPGDDLDGLPF